MKASEHIDEAELMVEIVKGLHTAHAVDVAKTHTLIAIAKSLDRLTDLLDLKIDLDRS